MLTRWKCQASLLSRVPVSFSINLESSVFVVVFEEVLQFEFNCYFNVPINVSVPGSTLQSWYQRETE